MGETFNESAYDDLARAIGRAALAWNSLQGSLGNLYWEITGEDDGSLAMIVWDAIKNDRSAANLLKDACHLILADDKSKIDDIVWLANRVNDLAEHRNSVLHARFYLPHKSKTPIADVTGGNGASYKVWTRPHPDYMEYVRATALLLRGFSDELRGALRPETPRPWPNKPQLQPEPPQRNPYARLLTSASRQPPLKG